MVILSEAKDPRAKRLFRVRDIRAATSGFAGGCFAALNMTGTMNPGPALLR
jgi:hypothetical protein